MTRFNISCFCFGFLFCGMMVTGCSRQTHSVVSTAVQIRTMRQDLAEGRRFPQELASAKAQGLPTSMADLQKPLPPSDQNAAFLYTQLRLLLKAHPFTPQEEKAVTLAPGTMPSQTQWPQIAAVLHKRADVMRLVHQAAARPQCVFRRDWTKADPADILFPELATVRESARLLEVESLLMAHQGKRQQAVQNQALGFNIARHAASDPTLISYLVGVAVDAITLDGMKRILYLTGPDAATADAVRSVITRDWKPLSLSSALKTEFAFNLGEIAFLRKAGPAGLGTVSGGGVSVSTHEINTGTWNALLDYNSVFMMREMERAIQAADRSYPEAKPSLDQFEAECTDKRHSARFLSAILAPSVSAVAGKRALLQAIVNIDLAGADVLIQDAHTGHPPDTLPSPASDPFTGKPLQYRREGAAGFVIYSVGADGHFDGGKPGEYQWKPYQVAFRYPGPLAAPR